MSKDAVFDRGERMFNRAPAQSHRFRRNALLHPVERVLEQMAGQPRLGACVQRGFSEQVAQSADDALYIVYRSL